MIQGMSQNGLYQMREKAVFAEANAGDITRRLRVLHDSLRTSKPIAKEDAQQFVAHLQNDTLALMNTLNGIALELNT